MQIPETDHRTENEILRQILRLAEQNTPEWKPDPANMDAGLALAKAFASMHAGTVRRLNRVAEKNRIAFCRFCGTRLRPSEPSSGYVQFGLSSAQLKTSVRIPAGTLLQGKLPEQPQQEEFTTVEDVCVSNAALLCMFLTDGSADRIQQVYHRDEETDAVPDFVLFGSSAPNQNRHAAWIGCQGGVFRLIGAGEILLELLPEHTGETHPAIELERAWQSGQLEICYSTEDGWEPFSGCRADGDVLRLQKTQQQPAAYPREVDGIAAVWIRLVLKDIRAIPACSIQYPAAASKGEEILPDAVLTKYGAAEDDWFQPFGERPSLLDALYIASDEALSKAGAWVTMQFTVSFSPVPEPKRTEKPAAGWKMVMRKSDVQVEETEIVWIQTVTWEYFNGTGWKTLPCPESLRKAFSPVEGTRTYSFSFLCPPDAQPVAVDAEERRFLRVRIVRMEQNYLLHTIFHLPLLSHIVFRYQYDTWVSPEKLIIENQMHRRCCAVPGSTELFLPMAQKEPAWYLCFTQPLTDDPHRILIALEQQADSRMPELRWEYYTENQWKPLNCYDDTGQLGHTGIFTISGNSGFQKRELFGVCGYWIRAVDLTDAYSLRNSGQLRPHILRMDQNCTEVQNCSVVLPEYFNLTEAVPHFVCRLSRRNICEAAVWTDELALHSTSETAVLLQQGQAEPEYDAYGVLQRLWVRWEPVDGFYRSGPDDRHYVLDPGEGTVTFGDGTHGRIPWGSTDGIRICCSIGGGSAGNVPEHTITSSCYGLGLVTKITNPMPFYGGNDMEQVPEAVSRTAFDLRSGGYCVTAQDYEDAARRTERSILKVRCIPGCNAQGIFSPGCMTILILRDDFGRESSGFSLVQKKVRQEILSRCAASVQPDQCFVCHPRYIRICVHVRVLASAGSRLYRLKEQIQQRITAFLHPITGNFDEKGWDIGELPDRQQVENAIRSVRGVSYVENLMLRAFAAEEPHQTELDLNHLPAAAFCIAISGEHSVQVESR